MPVLRPVSETFETWKAHYREELLEVFQVAEILRLEEEAKRRGAWLGEQSVKENEPPRALKKENAAPDGDGPQQTEDNPTRRSMFFGR